MSTFYPASLESIPDAELKQLQKEIEDAGVLMQDPYDYEETDWIRQAYDRYFAIDREIRRRWELVNPEEAERQRVARAPMAEMIRIVSDHWRKSIFHKYEQASAIAEAIRKPG